jgi:hypothetical protein
VILSITVTVTWRTKYCTRTGHNEPPVFRGGHYLCDDIFQLVHPLVGVVVVHVLVLIERTRRQKVKDKRGKKLRNEAKITYNN